MALADDDVRFTLDSDLTFRPISGSPIRLQVRHIDVAGDVVLHGELDLGTWERLRPMGAFHVELHPAPSGWDDDRPVEVVLKLRDPFTRGFDVADDWLAEFAGSQSAPSRHTEAWVLVEAVQTFPVPGEDPGLETSIGVQLDWPPTQR